jgi:restriction system protein
MGKIKHLYHIRQAKKIIKKLKIISKEPGNGGKIMNYLRKINPYIFEELILTAIEDSNVRIIRNTRYSGDGGVDGIFKTKKGNVLIQCKRYSSYISHWDVEKLCTSVKKDNYYMGIFVHTGKTGGKSKDVMKLEGNILFISGSTLIDVVLGKINIVKYIENRTHFFTR